ncbi:MAG: HPF1 family protein [Pleurocapsa sp. SU_196_0]|nr:HPF1 family protein [Pleurocapsa sp. SU_196_0]
MSDDHDALKAAYGFNFPDEFFAFREFTRTSVGKRLLNALGIRLEGPFQFLDKDEAHIKNPLWASRYYDDPPEFFTVLSGMMDGLHWGYYLDDPNDTRMCVAGFYSNDAFDLSIDGDTLFEVLRNDLEYSYGSALLDIEYGNEKAENQRHCAKLDRLREHLMKHATGDRPEMGEEYTEQYKAGSHRAVVAATRESMGIVVPEALYRSIAGRDFAKHSTPQPSATLVKKCSREALELLEQGFPGAALKLGKDLWISQVGRDACFTLLERAYEALERPLLKQMLGVARDYRTFCDARRK